MRGPPGPMGLTGRPGPVVCKQNGHRLKNTVTQVHWSHAGLAYTSVCVLTWKETDIIKVIVCIVI